MQIMVRIQIVLALHIDRLVLQKECTHTVTSEVVTQADPLGM